MRIVVDSSIICADFQLASSSFRVFFDGIPQTGHSIYIPKLVIDEVRNKYAEELQSCQSGIQGQLGKVHRVTGQTLSSPLTDDKAQQMVEEYDQMLEACLRQVGATILEYPTVSHEIIVQRELCRKKPFSRKGGYRDYLIWENILTIAENENEPVAFITKDRDFADDEFRLHPDLVADIKQRGLEPDCVILFESLERFVNEHIKPTMEVLEDVRIQLSAGTYPHLQLETAIVEQLPDFIGGIEFEPYEIGFPPEFESPTISLVLDVSEIEVRDVRRLSSGEFLVWIDAVAECEFDFGVYKADWYVMAEEARPSVWNHDTNAKYVTASATKLVDIALYLTFDPDSGEVTSMELTYISEAFES